MTHGNKLGMFIHWGIYSLTGLHEQAQARYALDRGEYERLATRFNPTEYDPEEWVLLAKRAGMKYICFTAKHHDGFCMWDTRQTDFSVMNTPYGRDVLKMLADACEKHGMLLSLYYSNPDWHSEVGYNPDSSHQWCARNKEAPDLEKYKEYVKAQVRELLTGYGRIYTFFWDIPPGVKDPSLNELVRELQPGILINDRGWDEGDFSTPEREYTSVGNSRFTRMTEACNSFGRQSWGYRVGEDFYSMRHIISSVDRIMAMGGSYLINVGPTPEGSISPEYRARLQTLGDWYNRMSGCLEGHECDEFDYGVHVKGAIVNKKGASSFFHFPEGLISSAFTMKSYPRMPKYVRLLNTGEDLKFGLEYLPESFDGTDVHRELLTVSGIPVDTLCGESIVVEICWGEE